MSAMIRSRQEIHPAAAAAGAAGRKNRMGIFGFGKKKEEAPACACSGAAKQYEAEKAVPEGSTGLTGVKVLGSGCKSCESLLAATNEALKEMSVPFEAEYVTDMAKIASYGVMSTPALVVNERVVAMGKVMSTSEVEKLLHKLGY